ncbi:oxidoreductase [Marmoricola endophyticus]|uniref:Oxidoreductase n=1 Tax=Marmoricola endophyticus TaxID=2040280 RepID=A0A917BA68_9ACTN|nr:molybdopterin-dependent oxidoreductase [Marmoricola endophyticus]GGF32382.1 oxidoreductase [Marmoricola endophyticus]
MLRQSRRGTTVLWGALAGLLAAAGGVGASMLLAALLGGTSSAYALGDRVIQFTPGWLKDFAVEKLGEKDKLVLLISVFAVVAILSALVGVLATRRLVPALVITGVLNLVALASAIFTSLGVEITVASVVPGLVATVVSVALLWLLGRSWRRTGGSGASAPAGFDRRVFLGAALASGGVAVVGGGASQFFGKAGEASRADVTLPAATTKAKPIPRGTALDIKGITPYMTPNSTFYRVDTALQVPQLDADTWRLRIHGMVDNELQLSFRDLLDMDLVEDRITLTCVSNQVGGQYAGNATWLGVPMKQILERVGVRSGSDAMVSTSADDMTITTPVKALTDDRNALLAVGMNGQPLPLEHGFPVRMVVPGLYGFVSATKWVTDMELTTFSDASTYWTKRGWKDQAPIKTFSRIDTPAAFSQVSGEVPIAGVAWAQERGIEKVELKIGDADWVEADLATEDSIDNWRQWVYRWKPAETGQSGNVSVQVRATDKTGYTQTSDRVPPRPDGATGWDSRTLVVS